MIPNTCIVVPCYNEENKLINTRSEYDLFLKQHDDILLCFVDDGSTDNTLDYLKNLKEHFDSSVEIISCERNMGKAEAVRKGVLFCNNKFDHEKIGFLDADLATSFDECLRLISYLDSNKEKSFVFASRISKVGAEIKNKAHRFLFGRIIASLISRMLDLEVYDTQCGCKIFTKEVVVQLFEEKFISKWLFDVELFFRLIHFYGKEEAISKMKELPLKLWVDKGDSKVKFSYFFRLWIDLFRIKRRYSKKL